MKLTCIQMDMVLGAPDANFARAEALVRRAAEEGPDVIVLPETWNTGFFPEDLAATADVDGARTKSVFGPLARELGVNIVCGSTAVRRGEAFYNAAHIFDRSGALIAEYDKTHLFSPSGEDAHFRAGDKLCGTRVIPLVIEEEKLSRAEDAAGDAPLLELLPWKLKTAAVIATGSEVARGLIQDAFTPVVEAKLAEFGIAVTARRVVEDGEERVARAIAEVREAGVELVLCTGGMSVDPDDSTPAAIRRSGARVVSYGAPVLPGAMVLLGYFDDGVPVLGLPGCVMYARRTVFDLLLPSLAAGAAVTREEIAALGEGGLCLGCGTCTFPSCGFGK